MKKIYITFISLVMVFTAFMFSACGGGGGSSEDLSDSKYLGTWKADKMTIGDTEAPYTEGVFEITLFEDGTGTLYGEDAEGTEETNDFKWSPTSDGFKTTGDMKLTFKDDGDNIKATILGVNLIFSRADGEGQGSDDEAFLEGYKYGYTGTDPIELAAYKYLCEVVAKDYESGEHSIAYALVVHEDVTNPEDVLLMGSYWVDNFNLEGDTLKCVSGGSHPGCFHLKPNEDGSYEVTGFDEVSDGSEFEPTAKKIFGDSYEDFMKAYSNDEARDTARYDAVSAYVNVNEIPATKFQDEGWDPIDLHL